MELNFSPASQDRDGRFLNNYRKRPRSDRGLLKFLKQWRGGTWTRPIFHKADNDPGWLADNRSEPSLTWIGHASFLLQLDGKNILTDPVLSDRVSPVQWAGPKRLAPLGLTMDELPPIDLVLVSHNHYDHLDAWTVRQLAARDQPAFCVPMGLAEWFAQREIVKVRELDWWQADCSCGLEVTSVPVQHFSGRGLRDRNRSLWCGFVVQGNESRVFFAGDTGYSADFQAIGQRFSPIDLSLIPIGAYDPRDFMRPVHVDPEEAVQIHQDLSSRLSIGMHWGTFRLTLEPLDEPPLRLARALRSAAIDPASFRVLKHGQTLML